MLADSYYLAFLTRKFSLFDTDQMGSIFNNFKQFEMHVFWVYLIVAVRKCFSLKSTNEYFACQVHYSRMSGKTSLPEGRKSQKSSFEIINSATLKKLRPKHIVNKSSLMNTQEIFF